MRKIRMNMRTQGERFIVRKFSVKKNKISQKVWGVRKDEWVIDEKRLSFDCLVRESSIHKQALKIWTHNDSYSQFISARTWLLLKDLVHQHAAIQHFDITTFIKVANIIE